MPIVIEPPFLKPKRTNVLFMLDEWSAGAALTTPAASDPGTAITDLQKPQPRDFWGQASPATILADRQDRALFGGIFMPFASVPRDTVWRRRYGDSAAERDGTHLRDASGNNRRVVLRAGAKCGAGLFAGGLELDASGTQYAETEAAFAGPSFGTLEVHVKATRRAQWLIYHAATPVGGGDGVARGVYMDANGFVHVYRGGGAPILSSAIAIPDDGGWHQVAYHFDDASTGDCALDLDGEAVAAGNNFTDPPTGILMIGNGNVAVAPIAASTTIDEIRYWPTTRTTADVQHDMGRELADSEATQLIAYYRCNAFDSGEQLFAAPAAYDLWSMPDPRCHGWDFLEAPWAARSARIDITGPTDGEVLRFGNLLMGATYQPSQQSAEKGRNYGSSDDTDYDRGPGGELVADPAGPYRLTEFTVDAIPQAELYGDWERLQLLFAGGRPGLVALNPADPVFQHHKLYYGVVKFQLFTERNWDHHVASVRVEGMP